MLKRRILVLTLVALMLALPVVAAAASAVDFADDNLEAAVRAALGIGESADVPQVDMKLLKKLCANDDFKTDWPGADVLEVIRKLNGLEYALNLKALDISGNNIKDLAPIRNLPLNFLNIGDNESASLNPSSAQMKILQEIQHRGAVVYHDGPVHRISGPDRYQTAVRIWQNMYTDAAYDGGNITADVVEYFDDLDTIVLARGDHFADALVGAPLAYELWAPILLTTTERIHPATKAAVLDYLDNYFDGDRFNIYVLGGTAAISDRAVNELIYAIETEFEGLDVKTRRIGGANRYETAVKIAEALDDEWDDGQEPNLPTEVIIAAGEDDHFADALCSGSYAALGGNLAAADIRPIPILLTPGGSLHEATAGYLKDVAKKIEDEPDGSYAPTLDVVVVGGSAAVSEKVIDQLNGLKYRALADDWKAISETARVWGADRYATSAKLFEHYVENDDDFDAENDSVALFLATGENFADALTGSVLTAAHVGWWEWMDYTGLLLVKQNSVPKAVSDKLDAAKVEVGNAVTILGGEAAVSLHNAVTVYNQVRSNQLP